MDISSHSKIRLTETNRKKIYRITQHQEEYYTYDADLGWTIKPNGKTDNYQANSAGIRSDHEYSLSPNKKIIRAAAFGDSFVHGSFLKNSETWEEQLDLKSSALEVLNFGAGAYGMDQAFLRYKKEGIRFHPQIVFIGFMTENIKRHVNTFRPFYTQSMFEPRSKPRFEIKNGQLTLVPNPLTRDDYKKLLNEESSMMKKLGAHDFYYQSRHKYPTKAFLPSQKLFRYLSAGPSEKILVSGQYNPHSEAFQVTCAIFDAFYKEVLGNHAQPVIIIFPEPDDIARSKKKLPKKYAPLLTHLRQNNYTYIDLLDVFNESAFTPHFIVGHFDADTNKHVATVLFDYLKEKKLITEK